MAWPTLRTFKDATANTRQAIINRTATAGEDVPLYAPVYGPDSADPQVVELIGRHHVQRLRHHEGLTVKEQRRHVAGVVANIAVHGPVGVTGHEVDIVGLEFREARTARQRPEFQRIGIAEHGRSHGAADVDVEAGPAPLAAQLGEPRQRVGRSTDQMAPRLDG